MDSDGKTSNKKRTTRFATLLQNELNSHVASFTKHEKKKTLLAFLLQDRFERGYSEYRILC